MRGIPGIPISEAINRVHLQLVAHDLARLLRRATVREEDEAERERALAFFAKVVKAEP